MSQITDIKAPYAPVLKVEPNIETVVIEKVKDVFGKNIPEIIALTIITLPIFFIAWPLIGFHIYKTTENEVIAQKKLTFIANLSNELRKPENKDKSPKEIYSEFIATNAGIEIFNGALTDEDLINLAFSFKYEQEILSKKTGAVSFWKKLVKLKKGAEKATVVINIYKGLMKQGSTGYIESSLESSKATEQKLATQYDNFKKSVSLENAMERPTFAQRARIRPNSIKKPSIPPEIDETLPLSERIKARDKRNEILAEQAKITPRIAKMLAARAERLAKKTCTDEQVLEKITGTHKISSKTLSTIVALYGTNSESKNDNSKIHLEVLQILETLSSKKINLNPKEMLTYRTQLERRVDQANEGLEKTEAKRQLQLTSFLIGAKLRERSTH